MLEDCTLMRQWLNRQKKKTYCQTHIIFNKEQFINMIGKSLEEGGCDIHHARDDAYHLVVKTALVCADQGYTVVIADDTDTMVLFIHYAKDAKFNIMFKPNPKRK